MRNKLRIAFFILLGLILSSSVSFAQVADAAGDTSADEGTPIITTSINYDDGLIVFSLLVKPNYHITNSSYFTVSLPENEFIKITDIQFPKGEIHDEDEVFKGDVQVKVLVENIKEITVPIKLTFTVGYQICIEQPTEYCLRPTSQTIEVEISRNFSGKPKTAAAQEISAAPAETETAAPAAGNFIDNLKEKILQELEKKSLFLFVLVFFAGFLASLTPCVYPVIPIVMGFIGTRGGKSKLKGFKLSLIFVLGLAVVYSIFGVLAVTAGLAMGVSFQNPIVVIVLAGIFIVMGLSLIGLFSIPVPSSISSKVHSGGQKGEIIGSLIIGGVSGIIAAPCVGPILIAILSWISKSGDILLGFLVTFVFSLGMGVIFLVAGTFSGAITAMPKGGKWMDYIKYFFAALLIAGGIFILTNITSSAITWMLWGVFLVALSVFLGLFSAPEEGELKDKFSKVLVVLIFIVGFFMLFSGLQMKFLPQQNLSAHPQSDSHHALQWIPNLEEGKAAAARENKKLMIDTTADWCYYCKQLEKKTFSDPKVMEVLKKDFILVQLDFTEKETAADKQLRKSLKVQGMPTVIFLNSQGDEIHRFEGFKNKDEFLAVLQGLQ